jgi:thioredoxin reductase/bacterioferritin-associated ferredoxin
MNGRSVELAIVGGGPAGLAAAVAAAGAGVETLVLDLYARAGGQYYKLPPASFAGEPGAAEREGLALAGAARRAGAEVWSDATVWGLYREGPFLLGVSSAGRSERLEARQVILAAGAYERPAPFPGWTLPGVMTAGAALALLKGQRVLAGRRVLLAGSGPLQWAAGAYLVVAGAQVAALLELRRPGALLGIWRRAGALLGQGRRLREGWQYYRLLRAAGAPLRFGWTIVRAEGRQAVEAAVIAKADAQGRPIAATEQRLAVDAICLGYGLLPATELAQQLDCAMDFEPSLGVFTPRRDAWMQTTVTGCYVAGDAAGINGKEAALLEGRLAGLGAALAAGRLTPAEAEATARPLRSRLARERRFAALLADAFGPLPGLAALADDDTVICRCEGATLGQVRQAIADGARNLADIKAQTRAGMGRCGGRMCYTIIAATLAREVGLDPAEASRRSVRPPAFPVALDELLDFPGSQTIPYPPPPAGASPI